MAKREEDGVWRTVGGRRIFIKDGESLTDAMKKSGKFKDQKPATKKPKRDTKFGDSEIKNEKEFETTREAMNAIAKQINETKDPEQKATLERVLKNYAKNLKEYQDKIAMENYQKREYADDNSLQKSIDALNKIDRLANEAQHYTNAFDQQRLEKKGREMGSQDFEEYVNQLRHESYENRNNYKQGDVLEYDTNHLGVTEKWHQGEVLSVESGLAGHGDPNPDKVYKVKDLDSKNEYKIDASAVGKRISGSKTDEIPSRFRDGFKVQNSKYSDESKMTLVEDGSGVRLIYDGKDTGTVLKNDLSDGEISKLRNSGKIQNMSEYLDERDRSQTRANYNQQLDKISKIKEDGTYDLATGKSKSYNDGYQVTFSMTDMGFNDKEYTDLVEKFKAHDHNTVDAGKFEGYPEISFNVTDMKKALKLGYKYNQKSVWDWKNGTEILTGGTGAYADYKPTNVSDKIKSQRKEKK